MSYQFDEYEVGLADSMRKQDHLELLRLVHDNPVWPRLYWVINLANGSVVGPMSFEAAAGLQRSWRHRDSERQSAGPEDGHDNQSLDYEAYVQALPDARTYRLALTVSG